ncbi:MAG: pantetheine-phosphate adenylyltransferase [Pelagibacteraceae bacterium]|jgi:pantetheine-phosphate adenylyltransferase
MKKIGLYPGTFDPITFGHLDIVRRAAQIVDTLYVGIASNLNKKTLFSPKERVEIVKNSLKNSLKEINNIKVVTFDTLTVNYCKNINASIIFRGLRVVTDFEYEFQLAGMNNRLDNTIQTIFLMADIENQLISSNMVKEIAELGGNVSKFAPQEAIVYLNKKLKNKK